MTPGFKRAVWILNTLGFVFYLAWLATMGDKQILREQDGIVYFLPTLPFFFVFMLLINPKPRPKTEPWWQRGGNSETKASTPPPPPPTSPAQTR